MVWRADNDGVDILLHFVEHDTIVVKLRHFGELTEAFCTSFFVDVTQGNDILAGDSPQIRSSLSSDADQRNI